MSKRKTSSSRNDVPKLATEEDILIYKIGVWREYRAKLRLGWARCETRSLFGTRHSDGPPPFLPQDIETMREAEKYISRCTPETGFSASLMLKMAIDILQEREVCDESTLAHGPVLQLIVQATSAIEWLGPDEKLAPPNARQ